MDPSDAISLTQQAITTALLLGAPLLLVGMAVGLLIGLAQALTQLQDRALLSIAVSLLITPLHWGLVIEQPNNLVDLGLLVAREAVLGLALGGAVMILLSGMQMAGQVISQMSGMSLADVVNPTFDT